MPESPATLTDASRALRDRTVSSVELVQSAIDRADRLDPLLGAYLHRFDGLALAAASQADAELAAGIDRGPLHGLPIGVKDVLAVAEGPTTANSLVHDPSWGEGRDAVVVQRLRTAGAVITGKLTTMEFAIGFHDADKPHPRPRNPWDPAHWPGGSSSGAGVGVAAGMFLAGLGTDTGGSIRIPAAYCGVCGLMPTYGRVSGEGCVPLGFTLDRIGPLARSARDCQTVLTAIAGEHPRVPSVITDASCELAAAGGDLHGLRIGVERTNHLGSAVQDPSLEAAFETAVEVLAGLGAAVTEVELPHYRETATAQLVTMVCEAFAYHRGDLQTRWSDYYRGTRAFVGAGALFTGADYVQAQRVRHLAQRRLAGLLAEVDVIATPTAATGAPSYELLDATGIEPGEGPVFTTYWNAVGNPALAVPMGFTTDGMPLSLQLAGRPFADASLVAIAEAYQAQTDWHLREPPALATVTDSGAPPSGARTSPSSIPALSAAPRGPTPTPEQDAAAGALLDAAGLTVADDERERLCETYARCRPDVEAMYALTSTRYEPSALVFQAQPRPEHWGA